MKPTETHHQYILTSPAGAEITNGLNIMARLAKDRRVMVPLSEILMNLEKAGHPHEIALHEINEAIEWIDAINKILQDAGLNPSKIKT
jgi:hypothetical protein